MIEIRQEQPGDLRAIRYVHETAFQDHDEADIVDVLRAHGAVLVSLVATVNNQTVGHILYSPASIGSLEGAALGPLAVLSSHQHQSIGTRLVEAGNQILRDSGCPFIIVIGHPGYYPRFGFTPAAGRGIKCEWDAPADAFMVLVLDEARMQGLTGLARYRREFHDLDVDDAILLAETLLPGEAAPDREKDQRWQAIIKVGNFIEIEPEKVWRFVERWGVHEDADLRMAVGTCLLEHLLEYHFDRFFPRVEATVRHNRFFANTFLQCWKLGLAEQPQNSDRFDALRVEALEGTQDGRSKPSNERIDHE